MGRWVDPVLEEGKFTTVVFSIKYKSASCGVKRTLLMKCRAVTGPPQKTFTLGSLAGCAYNSPQALGTPPWAGKVAEGRTGRRKYQGRTGP